MSDYWDLESSHTSQQLGPIGRTVTEDQEFTEVDFRHCDSQLGSQVFIQDPLQKVQRLPKQIADNQSYDGSFRQEAEESDSFLGSQNKSQDMSGADSNLENVL